MKITRRNVSNKKNVKMKRNRNKNKTRRRKMQGGDIPKLNLAYTYLILNYTDYIKYIDNSTNNFLLMKQNQCNCMETATQCNTYIDKEYIPILKNENEHLILVMKYKNMVQFYENLKKNINLFRQDYFRNEILGSAIIRKYTGQNIMKIGIYSICLYLNEKQGKGYGSVLFNIILHSINALYLTPNPDINKSIILWLGIRLENPNFKKLAYLYTSFGFENPKVISNDLNGVHLNFKIMEFSKEIDDYVTNEDTTKITFVEAIDIYQQAMTPSKLCKFKFTLDKSAILNLRLIPYLNTSGKFDTILRENDATNNEYSGSLFIYNASYNETNGDVQYKLSLETKQNNKGVDFVQGEREGVNIKEDQRTFHTHPILAYVNHKRLVGFPSGQDISTVFSYGFNKMIQFQFHMVISIEGIYILSLSEKCVNAYNEFSEEFIRNLITWVQNNKDLLQYNPELSYDWVNGNPENYAKDVLHEVNKFLFWFNNLRSGDFQLNHYIQCQFYPWKNIHKNTVFEVFYHNTDGRCYPSRGTPSLFETTDTDFNDI